MFLMSEVPLGTVRHCKPSWTLFQLCRKSPLPCLRTVESGTDVQAENACHVHAARHVITPCQKWELASR